MNAKYAKADRIGAVNSSRMSATAPVPRAPARAVPNAPLWGASTATIARPSPPTVTRATRQLKWAVRAKTTGGATAHPRLPEIACAL